jgi:hypothetical protein
MINDNVAVQGGGGIYCSEGNASISYCNIKSNHSQWLGGGINFCLCDDARVNNCMITDNTSGTGAAAIGMFDGHTTIDHCTVTKNTGSPYIGSIYCNNQDAGAITNSIVWDNAGWWQIRGGVNVTFCDVGKAGCSGEGNINTDPLFVSSSTGNYHLLPTSPCINTGNPNYQVGPDEVDIDGDPRVMLGRVDMGADEFFTEASFIELSASEFTFVAVDGEANPEEQVLTIRNIGIAPLTWEIIEDCSWLDVWPNSGGSTGEIDEVTLAVDISKLDAGLYNFELVVTANEAANSPQTIKVKLNILAPVIELSKERIEFGAYYGGENPEDQILIVRNSGIETLNWTIRYECDWLEVNPMSGQSSGESNEVTLAVDTSDMGAGRYSCELTITGDWATNSPETVTVILGVFRPVIEAMPSEIEFFPVEGQRYPDDQPLNVRNSGTGTLSWTIVEGCPWLEANPFNGDSTGEIDEVALATNIEGLAPGDYNYSLNIVGDYAANSPLIIPVNLHVSEPYIKYSPATVDFVGTEKIGNPADQILSINNAGGGTLNWQLTADSSWLDINPAGGECTGEIDEVVLSVDPQGLGEGTHNCELTVSSNWATNSPQVVSVTLYIGVALHVPSEYPTIRAAINAAEKGDTVLIADGVYTGDGNRDIDFKGKAITVRSENGPENCIIDCQRSGRGFVFYRGEDKTSVLDGLTITNGYTEFFGGGICCADNSNPTIINCDIIDNVALMYGGGIGGYKSKPAISNCLIAHNSARTDGGGGLFGLDGRINNCIITANKADNDGGGLLDCDGDIANCIITGNVCRWGGGGLEGCHGNITGCTVSNNKSQMGPGGLEWCTGSIANCIIRGNFALHGPQSQLEGCAEPTYSCIQDWPYGSSGNIDQDPLFVAPGKEWVYWDLTPLCHWKFDEGQGDTAYDTAGVCHGQVVGAEWSEGQVGAALRFDGEFSRIVVPFNYERPLWFGEYDSLSISAWIKCNKDRSDIVNKGFSDGVFYDGGFCLGVFEGTVSFGLYDSEIRWWSAVVGTTVVIDEKWHYVVAVRDTTQKKLYIYLDGRPDATPSAERRIKLIGSAAPVIIGEHFGGVIDEPVIYGSALSNEQIEQFYAAGLSGERYDNKLDLGDYHLASDSPCIDRGDPNYVPKPNDTDADGGPRLVDGDNDGMVLVDMGAYEYWPPMEVGMRFTPGALNPGSHGKWVKVHFVLPEGYTVEDVDANEPVRIIKPFELDIESEYMNIFVNEANLVEVEAAFYRGEFCAAGIDGNSLEVTAAGSFSTGQQFCGTETIKITSSYVKYLGNLASYWLRTGCGKPDWCEGADIDRDSAVDFVDFALFEGCCVEVVAD